MKQKLARNPMPADGTRGMASSLIADVDIEVCIEFLYKV